MIKQTGIFFMGVFIKVPIKLRIILYAWLQARIHIAGVEKMDQYYQWHVTCAFSMIDVRLKLK